MCGSGNRRACQLSPSSELPKSLRRLTAMAFVGSGALSSIAHAAALTKAQRDKLSPDDILALMKKGNKRFYTGKHRRQ